MQQSLSRGLDLVGEQGLTPALSIIWQYTRQKTTEQLSPIVPLPVVEGYYAMTARLGTDRSDANPAHPIWIEPEEIEFHHGSGPAQFGLVAGGEWDSPDCWFEEHPVHQSLRERFENGAEWPETPLYRAYRARIEAGDPYWRCQTESALTAYVDSLDELYERIVEDGYRSQRELLSEDPESVYRQNTDAPHPLLQEIGVNIYRDGRVAKKGAGLHRLSIAKLADVDLVPVTVRVRHRKWQAIRDEVNEANALDTVSDRARRHLQHPDLGRIVPPSWQYETEDLPDGVGSNAI